MRRVLIDDPSLEGAHLVRDLVAPGGEVLARSGMLLTARSVRALRQHGVGVAFIDDRASFDVSMRPLLTAADEGGRLARALRDVCAVLQRFIEPPARHPTARAIAELKDARTVEALDVSGAFHLLRAAVNALLERATTMSADAGFVTDRQATDDLVGHSVGVAAITARLGAALGFADADLHWATIAAALHDVGLLMVPEEIRRTPEGQRTPAQQRRHEDHTLLGEAILRPLEKRSAAIPLVAVEHHEEQSGCGFPWGMPGGNRILSRPGAGGPPRIALVSEVVAVADRYERLISPSPGVPALSPAAARNIVAEEAGARLNAEVVGRFLDLVPDWPLGTEVIIHGGAYSGSRAVVLWPSRPGRLLRVRIFAMHGFPLDDPIEVDFGDASNVTLTPADEAAEPQRR